MGELARLFLSKLMQSYLFSLAACNFLNTVLPILPTNLKRSVFKELKFIFLIYREENKADHVIWVNFER